MKPVAIFALLTAWFAASTAAEPKPQYGGFSPDADGPQAYLDYIPPTLKRGRCATRFSSPRLEPRKGYMASRRILPAYVHVANASEAVSQRARRPLQVT